MVMNLGSSLMGDGMETGPKAEVMHGVLAAGVVAAVLRSKWLAFSRTTVSSTSSRRWSM